MIETLTRPGWVRDCPNCGQRIIFTTLRVDPPTPFFYSDACLDVLLRKSDALRAEEYMGESGQDDEQLHALWQELLQESPKPPCGGAFTFWANFHCPHCQTEIPYNAGIRDLHRRLWESTVVVVDGATVVGDSPAATWRARVVPEGS